MNKIIIWIIIIGLVIIGAIFGYQRFGVEKELPYQLADVIRGDIYQEVSESGTVKAAEEINLAFERSGVVSGVFVEVGQEVERGALLAQLDTTDAEKKVKDAKVNLENAKLALDKINLEKEQLLRGDILNKSYEDGMAVLSGFYDETATILDSLDSILFGKYFDEKKENIKYYADYDEKFNTLPDRLSKLYGEAEKLQTDGIIAYQLAQRGSGEIRNEAIRSGYDLAVKLAEIIKLARDVIRNLQDFLIKEDSVHLKESIINEQASRLSEYDLRVNDYLEDLINIINTINDYDDKLKSLPLDIKTKELLVQQRENELTDAKNNLAKHFLYSPINGLISKQDLKKGEIVTANIPVIEIFSPSEFEIVVDIYEEDIVKVKVNDPVDIILTAFPEKTLKGKVISINPAEKLIEGVVYYEVKIAFDEVNEDVKAGMTADLVIKTASKSDVLIIPEEAIKEKEGKKIVRVFKDGVIEEREVETGLLGSDDMIEIISGLKEGEKVIVKEK